MTAAIWWIRRDLRLHDNHALRVALSEGAPVIPLFVIDPSLIQAPLKSDRRIAFLLASLRSLDSDLQQRGSRLVVRIGDPRIVIPAVVREVGARVVVAEADVTPYARRRDTALAATVPLRLVSGLTIHPPGTVLTPEGRPYTVFSQFARAWWRLSPPSAADLIPAPEHLPPIPNVVSDPLPHGLTAVPDRFPAGEAAARRRLHTFLQRDIARYASDRDRLDGSGSSQLSPYFRFGLLSVREAWSRAAGLLNEAEAASGARAWLNELLWREFYQHLLAAYPESVSQSMREPFRHVPWPGEEPLFGAWRDGVTGYPVIDAAMRQLAAEGWISNRARMLVANFLSKLLLIDWRRGERYFRQQLIDGDLAANVGGWQWSAGTGTDAAPYFRIFNPIRQGELFDPSGSWTRQWLPELRNVPHDYLFAPWRMPDQLQRAIGCQIGRDYPRPIVTYEVARQRALEWFQGILTGR